MNFKSFKIRMRHALTRRVRRVRRVRRAWKIFPNFKLCLILLLLSLQPDILCARAIPDRSLTRTAPSLDTTANGTTLVNITAPSAAGVSHNHFQALNIDPQGMVFNNAKKIGTSRIGGVAFPNPNLRQSKTARIILNEVTGSTASDLRGFAEIFGDRAQLVIANPNGITCDGCGFINTNRVTLGTGTAVTSDGDLLGMDIDGFGLLSIEGAGLNADDIPALTLLARVIYLQSPVNAHDLKIFTGRNLYDYGAETVTVKTDDSSIKPALAIDATHFGSMYANRIQILATEEGIGVKLPAGMATGHGDFTLTADGNIELGNVTAGKITIDAKSNRLNLTGAVTGSGAIDLAADRFINDGNVIAGLDTDGAEPPAAGLTVTTKDQFTNNGRLQATGDSLVTGGNGRLTNATGARINSRGNLTLTTTGAIDNRGQLLSDKKITLRGNRIVNDRVTQNTDIGLTGTDIEITVAQILQNSGDIAARNDVKITGPELQNKGGTIQAQENFTFTGAPGDGSIFANQSGDIKTHYGDLVIHASEIINQQKGNLTSGANLYATANRQITNKGAIISKWNHLHLTSDILENDGGILYAKNILTFDGPNNSPATRFANRSGHVETENGDITITAGHVINARKNLTVTTKNTYRQTKKKTVSVFALHPGIPTRYLEYNIPDTLYFTHPDDPGWHLYYDYGPLLITQETELASNAEPAAFLSSGNNLTIHADTIDNHYSYISAVNDIAMTGRQLENKAQILNKRTFITKQNGLINRCYSNKKCVWIKTHGYGKVQLSRKEYDRLDAFIQAGGNFTGAFTARLDNKTIFNNIAEENFINSDTISPVPDPIPFEDLAEISLRNFLAKLPARDALVQRAPPGRKAVFESRLDFIDPSVVLGGDYFLSRTDFDPEAVPKRFAFNQRLEEILVERIINLQTGRRWLDPSVRGASHQLKTLLDNGIAAQQRFNLTVGVALSKAQMDNLTRSLIWYVEEEIKGEKILVPRLYLAHADRAAFSPQGAVIEANNITTDTANITNNGQINATAGSHNPGITLD